MRIGAMLTAAGFLSMAIADAPPSVAVAWVHVVHGVLRTSDGTPFAGFWGSATSRDDSVKDTFTTAADGTFSFLAASDQDTLVDINNGYDSMFCSGAPPTPGQIDSAEYRRIVLPGYQTRLDIVAGTKHTYRVVARDRDDMPIVGVSVDPPVRVNLHCRTVESGELTLHGWPVSGLPGADYFSAYIKPNSPLAQQTDAEGSADLELPGIKPLELGRVVYALTPTATLTLNPSQYSAEVTEPDDRTTLVTVHLPDAPIMLPANQLAAGARLTASAASVGVRVERASGEPLAGVFVGAFRIAGGSVASAPVALTTTTANGSATFSSLPAGSYRMIARNVTARAVDVSVPATPLPSTGLPVAAGTVSRLRTRFPKRHVVKVSWSSAARATKYRIRLSRPDSKTKFGPWAEVTGTTSRFRKLRKGSTYRVEVVGIAQGGLPGPVASYKFKQKR